jgi:hypothetical protein
LVTAAADPGRPEPTEIIFGNGNRAVRVDGLDAEPGELLGALGLESGAAGGGVIVVCGGADNLTGESLTRAEQVLGPAVSAAAQVTGAVVFDGGTASGVMALTGAARAGGRRRCRCWPVWRPRGWCPTPEAPLVVTGSGWRRTILILFLLTVATGTVRPGC